MSYLADGGVGVYFLVLCLGLGALLVVAVF